MSTGTIGPNPERAAQEPAFELRGLRKTFGGLVALDDVSFRVPRGSIFGLLGPNGAGKTTVFSIMAGFLHRDAGEVRVLDTDADHPSRLQGRLSILPQDAAFQANVPILEQLVFFRRLDGQSREQAEREVRETLEMVGLGDYIKRGVRALSHGMLKRMGIAQAFLGRPEVILLDEPTSGLDPKNAAHIRDLVRELVRDRNVTVLFSSHNLAEIQDLCDHVAILDKGKLVGSGAVEDITRRGLSLALRLSRPLTAEELAALSALPAVQTLQPRPPDRYEFELTLPAEGGRESAVAAVLRWLLDAGVVPTEMSQGHSLENYFLQVTGQAIS